MLDVLASKPRELPDPFAARLCALRPDLRARALRLTRNDALAEDVVQDALERALKFRAQFQPDTNLKSWAQTIVFSVFVTRFRRHRRERDALKVLAVDPCAWTAQDPVDPGAEVRQLSPRVQAALDALAPSFREVLLLVDVGEVSYRDAARALDVPIGTVMSRLHRARKQLAAALTEEGDRLAA